MASGTDTCCCKTVTGIVRSDTLNEGDHLFEKDSLYIKYNNKLVDFQNDSRIKVHTTLENVSLFLPSEINFSTRGNLENLNKYSDSIIINLKYFI